MFRKLIFLLLPLLFILQCSLPEPDDYIPPVTLLIYPYDGAIVADDILQVRVEATDDDEVSRVRIFLDGEEVGTSSSRPYLIDVNVADKKDNLPHVIQAAAIDKSDNTGYSTLVRFTIARSEDVTDPVVAIVNPQDGQQVEGTVKIVAFADDDYSVDRVVFFIDGDSVGQSIDYPYTYNWNTTDYADSTNHTIFARAFDSGDNWSVSDVITVTVYPSTDQTAPSAILTYPTEGQVVYDTVYVTVEASDNKGMAMVEYFVDGLSKFVDVEAPYIFAWDTRPYANDGEHSVYAKAYDAAGNTMTTTIVNVTIPSGISDDITPPTARITYPVDGTTVAGTVTVTVDVDDNIGITQVQYFVDGQPIQTTTEAPWSITWNTAPIADGSSHTLFVKAFDAAGNSTSSDLLTLTVVGGQTIDTTPPVAAITYPVGGSTIFGAVPIVINATDNVGVDYVEFYVDGEMVQTDNEAPWAFSWNTVPIADNRSHTIFIRVYDPAGNSTTSATVSVTLAADSDTEPPAGQITYPVDGAVLTGTITININAEDDVAVSHVDLYVDGLLHSIDNSEPFSFNWNTNNWADGAEHTLFAKLYDTSNNFSTTDIITVTIEDPNILDITPPVAFITYPLAGSVVDGSVNISIDAEDENGIARVAFYVDGDSVGSDAEWPYVYNWNTLTENDGIHTIYAKAYDPSGNMGNTALISVTVTNQLFDVEEPAVEILYPVAGGTVSGTVNVVADAADNVGVTRVEFYVDGILRNTDNAAPWSFSWDTTAEDNKEHTLYVKAYDAAGNVGNSGLLVITTSN